MDNATVVKYSDAAAVLVIICQILPAYCQIYACLPTN